MFSVWRPHAFKAVGARIKFNLGLSKFISTLGLQSVSSDHLSVFM